MHRNYLAGVSNSISIALAMGNSTREGGGAATTLLFNYHADPCNYSC